MAAEPGLQCAGLVHRWGELVAAAVRKHRQNGLSVSRADRDTGGSRFGRRAGALHGDVVTNAHVVENATRFVVTLASGDSRPAILVGRDTALDLAVIRIKGARPRPATFANSAQVKVGDLALAIGNPLGLRSSVTEGIVSAVGRDVAETDNVTLSSVIQTSAAINPGNSGGALVDLSGQVIGIPTLAAVDPEMGTEAPGIGFAIASNTVRRAAIRLTFSVTRHDATRSSTYRYPVGWPPPITSDEKG